MYASRKNNPSLNILQVNTEDVGGGAEKVAMELFRAYRHQQYGSWFAVGYKRSDDPDVLPILNDAALGLWYQTWKRIAAYTARIRSLQRFSRLIAHPSKFVRTYLGQDDYTFPASKQLLTLPPRRPDIIHAHNLHGSYFDLRILPKLSRQLPLFMTLHDAWLLSGHCNHSFDCERWKTGCGTVRI